METRKVAVEDDNVVVVHLQIGGGVQTVVGDVDGHGWSRRPSAMSSASAPNVLDHEHPHVWVRLGLEVGMRQFDNYSEAPFGSRLEVERAAMPAAMAATMERPSPAR